MGDQVQSGEFLKARTGSAALKYGYGLVRRMFLVRVAAGTKDHNWEPSPQTRSGGVSPMPKTIEANLLGKDISSQIVHALDWADAQTVGRVRMTAPSCRHRSASYDSCGSWPAHAGSRTRRLSECPSVALLTPQGSAPGNNSVRH